MILFSSVCISAFCSAYILRHQSNKTCDFIYIDLIFIRSYFCVNLFILFFIFWWGRGKFKIRTADQAPTFAFVMDIWTDLFYIELWIHTQVMEGPISERSRQELVQNCGLTASGENTRVSTDSCWCNRILSSIEHNTRRPVSRRCGECFDVW